MTGSAPSHKQWPVAMRDAVWRHLSELANAAGMSPDGKVSERVSKLAGRDKVHTLNAGFSENPITFQCASFRSQRVTPSSAPPSTVTHADERAARSILHRPPGRAATVSARPAHGEHPVVNGEAGALSAQGSTPPSSDSSSQAAERSPVPHVMRSAVRLLCSILSRARKLFPIRSAAEAFRHAD